MLTLEKLQRCYDSEINFKIETFFDSGITVYYQRWMENACYWIKVYQGYSFEEGINLLHDKLMEIK
jgi:hypothetical protein